MIRQCLLNKNKNATLLKSKKIYKLNKTLAIQQRFSLVIN
jgi:hypothetical protein